MQHTGLKTGSQWNVHRSLSWCRTGSYYAGCHKSMPKEWSNDKTRRNHLLESARREISSTSSTRVREISSSHRWCSPTFYYPSKSPNRWPGCSMQYTVSSFMGLSENGVYYSVYQVYRMHLWQSAGPRFDTQPNIHHKWMCPKMVLPPKSSMTSWIAMT